MVSMTAPTKRKLFFLTDPIEDWPRDWADYKKNYEATFTAQLLYPTVADYEVMPWPERIYTRPYKLANSEEKVLIPKYYSTQMQVMVNALNRIEVSANKVTGNDGIGVLMGNSLMFQRFPVHNSFEDPQFSNFYGQTLPLVKRGVPVTTVHMENLAYPATLKDIKVLVMSYSNMKPVNAEVHQHLAAWVKKGGVLVYCGADDDPYQQVMEWWKTKGNKFTTPSAHLFELLQVKPGENGGVFHVGKGTLYIIKQNPKEFVLKANGEDKYISTLKQAYETSAKAGALQFKNNFYLQRGPYDIVSVMDENTSTSSYEVMGPVIDLFDPKLPALAKKVIEPGSQGFLFNINRVKDKNKPQVIASACRIYDEKVSGKTYSFICKSPLNTRNSMRVLLPVRPSKTEVLNNKAEKVSDVETSWDEASRTLYFSFDNSPDGIRVTLSW